MASVAKREWTYKGVKKSAWVIRYLDQTGKKRQETFEKKKDADRRRQQIESELQEGMHTPAAATATVAAVGRAYLESFEAQMKDGRKAKGTYMKERFYIDRHIVPHLGAKTLRDLTTVEVDNWISSLRTGGKLRGQGPLQPPTIKQTVRSFSRLVDYGLRRGMVTKNVVSEVGRWAEHRNGRQVPIRTFKTQEVQTLLRSIQGIRPGWTRRSESVARCAVYLAAFCGLRLGEVLGLTWEHVDFQARAIRVRHSLDAWDNLKCPKTKAGMRDVPMPDMVAHELMAWRPFYVPNKRNLLFRTRSSGKKMTTAGFHRHIWQRVLEEADLGPETTGRRFHYHALRHFAASMMIEHQVPLADVAEVLGHSSFDMTLQVYAHPMMGRDHRRVAVEGMVDTLVTFGPKTQEGRMAPQVIENIE